MFVRVIRILLYASRPRGQGPRVKQETIESKGRLVLLVKIKALTVEAGVPVPSIESNLGVVEVVCDDAM